MMGWSPTEFNGKNLSLIGMRGIITFASANKPTKHFKYRNTFYIGKKLHYNIINYLKPDQQSKLKLEILTNKNN